MGMVPDAVSEAGSDKSYSISVSTTVEWHQYQCIHCSFLISMVLAMGWCSRHPPGSLFATGPSGSVHHAADETENDDDDAALVRRNPPRNRRAPGCGTGGHRGH
ncbi:hypothetical protein V6N13_056901 [Hibiscus sabdariffa]